MAGAATKPRVSARGRKQKGTRFEHEFGRYVGGERVPLSGALKHISRELSEDSVLPTGERVQCKVQHDGFKTLYKWLADGADMLGIKADGKVPLAVVPLPLFATIYGKARLYDGILEGEILRHA